jgi:hypothetical protein
MQFQVPQFIETEDKIIAGFFSMRQFIYVSIAGGFCFIFYFTLNPLAFIFLTAIFMGVAFSFAFITVHSIPLTRIFASAFSFYWHPKTYIWQPEHHEAAEKTPFAQGKVPSGISLEDVVAGYALRNAWANLQSGTRVSDRQFYGKIQERYQIFQKMTGDRAIARRIDYR